MLKYHMLYIVSTSIGNIFDTALRAVKTLTAVDIILTEDARTFDIYYKKIQKIFNLKPLRQQKIVNFNKDNEFQQMPSVISYLKEGRNAALVSESGTPTIADPGSLLLQRIITEKLPYTVIPGPTAFINAVVLSGFKADKILFLGFLPKKQSQLVKLFNQLKQAVNILFSLIIVFYESPHRINKTLSIFDKVLPEAEICLCREMTKKFEEIIRGKAKELMNKKFKGEITVVVKLLKM